MNPQDSGLPGVIVLAGVVVTLAALVRGAVGYGMGLIAAPLLALVDPALVPVPLIMLTTGHSMLSAARWAAMSCWGR